MLDKSTLSAPLRDNPTINPNEVAKFDRLAKEWWDPNGKMKSALAFNKARLGYIKNTIADYFALTSNSDKPFADLSLLDVGCGGGLLSEPLAELGAAVTGIDASAVSIEVAKAHAKQSQVEVNYLHMLSNELVKQNAQFDVVINAEVVEHVKDQQRLIHECCKLVKPGGLLILATLNKTIKSYVIAIVGAEYILRYLPIGTHEWRYFVSPKTLSEWTSEQQFALYRETGMAFNPLSGKWRYTTDMSVNYVQCFANKC